MHSKASFLACQSLRDEHRKNPNDEEPAPPLTSNEAKAVAKTLGRLLGGERRPAISEVLWLHGKDDRVGLPEAGLIAISVDITTLREEKWLRENFSKEKRQFDPESAMRGPFLPDDTASTQEGIVKEIIERSKRWAKTNRTSHLATEDGSDSGRLPILLTNVSIVHGSSAFDILINISMRDEDALLRFTREVIQQIPHVRGTQTMLVSQGYGFSDLQRSPGNEAQQARGNQSI
jgi:DNA-binding Lrp family transcriptional regulator